MGWSETQPRSELNWIGAEEWRSRDMYWDVAEPRYVLGCGGAENKKEELCGRNTK
jgi:hypothetical protein